MSFHVDAPARDIDGALRDVFVEAHRPRLHELIRTWRQGPFGCYAPALHYAHQEQHALIERHALPEDLQ